MKRGVVYDHETNPTLNVTVTVSDAQGGTDARAVMITVVDVPEASSAPARPTVRATAESSRSLDVTWSEPDNMGPDIIGYEVRYRKSGSNDSFRTVTPAPTTTKATIAPTDDSLTPGTSYEVSVRANNGEIPSQWSAPGTGRTSIGNSEPKFDDRSSLAQENPTTSRTVAENTRPGQPVGRVVGAVDGNGDRLTYRLVPEDDEAEVDNFDINSATGQILTKAPLNHEDRDCGYNNGDVNPTTCMYTVKVQVWDGLNEDGNEEDTTEIIDDTITVNIIVSDVVERPAAPTVTVTSLRDGTTLMVTWDEPDNTGPAITGYWLECTGTDVPDNQCPRGLGTSTVTDGVGTHRIENLTAGTSYRVRLRAENNEGDGAWSSWVTQSTNKENNVVPEPSTVTELYVAENAPSAREPVRNAAVSGTVVTVAGTPGDSDTLTYRLEGPGADRFNIDRNGQITTRSKLNYEDPECDSDEEGCTYSVRVKVSDPNGGSTFQDVTIDVTDVDEPPAKPATPRVTATSGSGWSLEVTWNEPTNTGPPITGYRVRYRKTGNTDDPGWRQWLLTQSNITERSVKITTIEDMGDSSQVHLDPRTQYEVQVRALNEEGDSDWSNSGRGTTGASNRRPVFDSAAAVVMLEVEENTPSGRRVGNAIEATDPDNHQLTYTLDGPNKDAFTINNAGQIRTRAALDYERQNSYSLTVKVNDGQRKNNSVAAKSVTVTVTDRTEAPSAPGAPTVVGIPGSTESVRVTWEEPANTGPDITHYRLRYAISGSKDSLHDVDVPPGNADRSAVITGLTAGTRYQVRVRAESPERHSDWSRWGTGSPNPDMENRVPAFSGGARTFSVAENTPPSSDVGSLVAALDPDGDVLTYILEGVDADSFDILSINSAGQIQTKAELNFEEKSSYSVAVRVRDGRGGTDAVNVTINVTDLDGEAPDTPFAPTVTPRSSTSLQVNWEAPDNAGPPITDYDYRYRNVSAQTWTEVSNTSITGTSETVDGLSPSTSYDVEVRATNAEGTSDWSNPGNGVTNAPGANNLPVFSEGASATRSVSASAQPGTNIGLPVAATDADSGDTLTYSLEGRDAANFDIDSTNGQLRTRTGITLIVGETYTVTVVADDGTDTASIAVSIEATAAPPNNAPVFTEGATATRTVSEGVTVGTAIGSPVAATDADAGTTLTYRLEGTDAASFAIHSTNGQLRTSAALDAATKSTYTVDVVASDGTDEARITVTITVTVLPASFGCATNGAVTDTSNTGLISDCEALLRSRNQLEGSARLNWSEATPIEDWLGVFRSGSPARVTVVALPRRGLNGSIPAALGQLDRLVQLNLHSNQLTGSVPAEIGNLRNLEHLLLHNNSLSGDFPDLRRLTRLKRIWFSGANNRIGQGDGIPTWLNNLTGLEELNLWGNEMGGSIQNLSSLSNLKLLKLQNNSLTGNIPTWLGGMNSLSGLYLHANNLTGSIPSQLGQLTRLRRLWLDRNQLTGTIPTQLGNMSNLGTLNLHTNRLSGSIPAEIGNLSRLQHIGFHNNALTGTIPSQLGNLSELTRLAVSNNQLSGSIPSSLGDLGKLRLLWLSQNQLTGTIPSNLGRLGNTLTNIKLAENSFDANACVPRALANVTTNDYSEAGLSICNN